MHLFYEFKDKIVRIRYQIVSLLFVITVLPIAFLQILNYWETSQKLQMKDVALLEDNLFLTQKILNSMLGDYAQILFQISTDAACADSISQMNDIPENSMQYRRLTDTLTTTIRSNIMTHSEVKAVGIITTNGSSFLYAEERESTENIIRFFNEHKEELQTRFPLPRQLSLDMITPTDSCYNPDYPYFFLQSQIMHHENLKLIGSVFLFIDPAKLNNEANNPASHTFEYSEKLLLNDTNHLLCSKSMLSGYSFEDISKYAQIDLSALPSDSSIRYGDYLISVSDTDYFNLKLVNIINYELMHHDLLSLWTKIILFIILILAFTLLGAFILCRNFVFSLEQMAEKINQVDEHNLDITIDTHSRNEMMIIERSVNRMLALIRNLLAENKRQYEHIVEITKAACEAELKSLELQINPHFLFNTIDSINWTAIRENCMDVSEQLNRLAYILRYTVYNMNTVVSVRDEMNWLFQYLELQKIRFHNSFSYQVYIPEEVYPLHIHKLLLQPFLENSLLHGFEGISWHGNLEIRFQILMKRYLLISISDNGRGMSSKQVISLNKFFAQKSESFQGIGLSNIFYRLRSYYPHHRLMVSSSPEMTIFKLFIPICEMEEGYPCIKY